ncbi:hypothetical protein DFQ26_008178 [Actinomortierella ambigua]|nr:hypothetical protein DFQ26_008178 [Actinomortierella ambigua]
MIIITIIIFKTIRCHILVHTVVATGRVLPVTAEVDAAGHPLPLLQKIMLHTMSTDEAHRELKRVQLKTSPGGSHH